MISYCVTLMWLSLKLAFMDFDLWPHWCLKQVTYGCRPLHFLTQVFFKFCFKCSFWPFYGFIDRIAGEVAGNRMRERGRDTQQRAPGWKSNPGPLQRGQSLCTWDARSTNWAKRRPNARLFKNIGISLAWECLKQSSSYKVNSVLIIWRQSTRKDTSWHFSIAAGFDDTL